MEPAYPTLDAADVAEQVGLGDAGMHGHGSHPAAGGREPPLQLEREDEIGELGVVVRRPARRPTFAVEVVEVELAPPVRTDETRRPDR